MATCDPTLIVAETGCRFEVNLPPPMAVEHVRPGSVVTTIDGSAHVQRAARRHRRFAWTVAGGPEDVGDWLALEQDVFGLPFRWYDPWAACVNLLPAEVTSVSVTGDAWRSTASSPAGIDGAGLVALDGNRCAARSISPRETLTLPRRDGALDPVPVKPGVTYTASAFVEQVASAYLCLLWYDQTGAFLSRNCSVTGGPQRFAVSAPAPTGAAYAALELTTNGQEQVLAVNNTVTGTGATSTDVGPLTADLDVEVKVAAIDWSPSQALVAQWTTAGNQRSWQFRISADGLALDLSSNGTLVTGHAQPFVAPIVAVDGQPLRVRFTRSAFTGLIRFYVLQNDVWVQQGATQAGYVGSLHASTGATTVGFHDAGTNDLNGWVWDVDVSSAGAPTGAPLAVTGSPDWTSAPWKVGDSQATGIRADAQGNLWTLTGADSKVVLQAFGQPGGRVAGFQLHEGAAAIRWHPGMGPPRVALAGGSERYLRIGEECSGCSGQHLRSFSVELVEVHC
jgi:hypothetical protein